MMKKLLSLFCFVPLAAFGQFEWGMGVGMSVNGTPSDNMFYQADKYIPNYAANGVVLKNFGPDKSWQAGVEFHLLQLANKSSKQFPWDNADPYYPEHPIGNDGTKFVFSQYTFSATAIANKKFAVGNGHMYLGIAVGYASARNFKGTGSPVVSYLAPDGGKGPVYGAQIGYTFKSSTNTSFNIELAPRYYSFSFDAEAPHVQSTGPEKTTLKFNAIAYPITLGFRYTIPDKHAPYTHQNIERNSNYSQIEYGIGGGMSQNGTPDGNVYYLGDEMIANYAANALVAVNYRDAKWQVGLEAHVLELASTSTKTYTGDSYYETVGGDGKKIVYSKITTALCAIGNKKFYAGRNELYLGLAVGLGIARNSPNYAKDEGYVAPDGGRGMVFGGQVGYTYNITNSFGLNVEFAPRYFCMAYDGMAPYFVKPHNNLYYNVWAYPVTFGFRIKINNQSSDDVPRFDSYKFQSKRENWR